MFEAANLSELRTLSLDVLVPAREPQGSEDTKLSPPEPSLEEVAVSPKFWVCLWPGGD